LRVFHPTQLCLGILQTSCAQKKKKKLELIIGNAIDVISSSCLTRGSLISRNWRGDWAKRKKKMQQKYNKITLTWLPLFSPPPAQLAPHSRRTCVCVCLCRAGRDRWGDKTDPCRAVPAHLHRQKQRCRMATHASFFTPRHTERATHMRKSPSQRWQSPSPTSAHLGAIFLRWKDLG